LGRSAPECVVWSPLQVLAAGHKLAEPHRPLRTIDDIVTVEAVRRVCFRLLDPVERGDAPNDVTMTIALAEPQDRLLPAVAAEIAKAWELMGGAGRWSAPRTRKELARLYRVCPKTVARWISSGHLPVRPVGGRVIVNLAALPPELQGRLPSR
jgi:hypothetical protein